MAKTKFDLLMEAIEDDPDKSMETVSTMVSDISADLQGTVKIDLPSKYAEIIDEFDELDMTSKEDINQLNKKLKSLPGPDEMLNEFSNNMETAQLNLGKIRSVMNKGIGKDEDTSPKNEALTTSQKWKAVSLVWLATQIFYIYVVALAYRFKYFNSGTHRLVSKFGNFIWAVVAYRKMRKMYGKDLHLTGKRPQAVQDLDAKKAAKDIANESIDFDLYDESEVDLGLLIMDVYNESEEIDSPISAEDEARTQELLVKCGKNPIKAVINSKKLIETLGRTELKGKVKFEVPAPIAIIYDKYEDMDESTSELDKEVIKKLRIPSPKKALSMMMKGEKRTVTLNLDKVRKNLAKASKSVKEKDPKPEDEKSLKESFEYGEISILDDPDPMNESAALGLSIGVLALYGISLIAAASMVVYFWYVIFLAAKYRHVNAFGTDKGTSGEIAGSIVLMLFFGFVWALLTHAQIREIKKSQAKNESIAESLNEGNEFDMSETYMTEEEKMEKIMDAVDEDQGTAVETATAMVAAVASDDAVAGVVYVEVPAKYADAIEEFNNMDANEADIKNLAKKLDMPGPQEAYDTFSNSTETKKVKLNLGKIKSWLSKGLKQTKKANEKNESIMTEAKVALPGGTDSEKKDDKPIEFVSKGDAKRMANKQTAMVVGSLLFVSSQLFYIYVLCLAVKYKYFNAFGKRKTKNKKSSYAFAVLGNFVWAVMEYRQLKKKFGKKLKLFEDVDFDLYEEGEEVKVDTDFVMSLFNESDGLSFEEEPLRKDDISTADLARAYQIVQADIAHRAPKDTNPTT